MTWIPARSSRPRAASVAGSFEPSSTTTTSAGKSWPCADATAASSVAPSSKHGMTTHTEATIGDSYAGRSSVASTAQLSSLRLRRSASVFAASTPDRYRTFTASARRAARQERAVASRSPAIRRSSRASLGTRDSMWRVAVEEREELHRRRRDDRRHAPAGAEKRDLAEEVAWTEICDYLIVDEDVGVSVRDREEAVAEVVLRGDLLPGRHGDGPRERGDELTVVLGQRREQRNDFEFRGVHERLSLQIRPRTDQSFHRSVARSPPDVHRLRVLEIVHTLALLSEKGDPLCPF